MSTPKLSNEEKFEILERWAWNNGKRKMQAQWKGELLGVSLSDAYTDGFYDGCAWLLGQLVETGKVKKG